MRHATSPNFCRAGSQETCQGNGEPLEGLEEEKRQRFPKARAAKSSNERGTSAPASPLVHLLRQPGLRLAQGPGTQHARQISTACKPRFSFFGFSSGWLYFLLAPREKFWIVYELWKLLTLKCQAWVTPKGLTFRIWWIPTAHWDLLKCFTLQIMFKYYLFVKFLSRLYRLTQHFLISLNWSQPFNVIKTFPAKTIL